MSEAVKISNNVFNNLLGLDTTKHSNPTSQPDNVSFVDRFTASETQAFLNRTYVKPRTQGSNISPAGIISYLKPIHAKVGNSRLAAEKLRALAPEIEQARILVSSSIMSPNDLQDGRFIFKFEATPAVNNDTALLKKVSDFFDHYFNDTLQLGIRSYDWIGEAQYGSGSKCILILPEASHIDLRNRKYTGTNPVFDGTLAMESFQQVERSSKEYMFSGKANTWKNYLDPLDKQSMLMSMIPSMESFGVRVPTKFSTVRSRDRKDNSTFGDNYTAGLEEMIINLKTKLSEGDAIRITEDSSVIHYYKDSNKNKQKDIFNKLLEQYGTNEDPINEEVAYLSVNPKDIPHTGHPTIIELPSEAVIPIIVPGAPSEHLGYFVLLDGNGMPLTIENSGMSNNSTECQSGSPNAAFEAMFGSNCCNSKYFSYESGNNVINAGSMIFSNILDGYVRSRIKGIFGRDDLTISRFNAVSSVLFYRLLKAKHSTMVFVPAQLLHYFAFDYDKNSGVGVSKTSEIQFLLSLRTTLMMANVVAMVNDAVEHKKVEFTLDEKNANLEGIMELIGNIFIEKNKLTGSTDPSEIMRDMYNNSLTIVPKNIPGLADLSIETQSASGSSSRVDDNLLEQLSNLLVSHLDVPPAALNQMSEPEFARSLVTYNLFFAKKIRRYQRIWCAMMNEFIRCYIKFDPKFKRALAVKLGANIKPEKQENLPSKVKRMKDVDPNVYDSNMNNLVNDVINTFTVELASPNIVVDKTQFEEIRAFMDNTNQLADMYFSNDAVPSNDELAQEALGVKRNLWKTKQITRFINEIGNFKMVTPPDMDEDDPHEITDYIQHLQNTGAAIRRQRETIGTMAEDASDGYSSSSYGDSSDSYGSDSGDDFGDDFGGGDDEFSMDDSESETTTEETSSEPASDFEQMGEATEGSPSLAASIYTKLKSVKRK